MSQTIVTRAVDDFARIYAITHGRLVLANILDQVRLEADPATRT